MLRRAVVLSVALAAGTGGAGAAERRGEGGEKAAASREFTLGLVQKELRVGLSQADVAERLGSPNIVAREAAGREAWVYDRVSTEVEVSGSRIGLGGLGSAAGGTAGGLLGIAAGKHSEKVRSAQKTLTVVVRFGAAGAVESFSWHSSRF